jgi:hypothetical protein
VRLLNEGLLWLRTVGAQGCAIGPVSGDAEAVSVGPRSLITCL